MKAIKVKVKTPNHVDHVLRCEEHCSLRVLVTRPENQSPNLQEEPAALRSAHEETRVIAGLIMAASLPQYICSQRPEYPAISGRKKHPRSRSTSLFNWSCSVWLFIFTNLKGIIKETYFEDVKAVKRDVTIELKNIPEESFQQYTEAW